MSATSSTMGGAQEQVQEKAQVAQEKVQQGAQQAKGRVREQVDQRSTAAGQQVNSTAEALRTTAEQLRSQGKDQPAQAAERAASQVEKVGGWLERSSGDDILHDVEDFGRRQPLAVAAAGLTLGFAAARFLKASSRERYVSRGGQGSSYRGRYASYGQNVSYGNDAPNRPLPARTGTGAGYEGAGTGVGLGETGARDAGSTLSGGVGSVDPTSDRL